MTIVTRCPRCGNVLSSDLGDRCPECLLQAGLAGSSAGEPGPATIDYVSQADTRAAGPALKAGQEFGSYHLVRALGQGGMGTVFEAEEHGTGRRLAVKVLSHSLDSPAARQRFFREGRLAASVNHPHSVYVFGTEEIDGAPVITMELVRGGTLQDRVRNKGPLPATDAVDAVLQVIDGLEAAHAVGVLHRDVKPSNCFVDAEGDVKIGDFGLSVSKIGRGDMHVTASGAFLGTPAFASPEQLRGDELDQRSDLYAVGVTLFYLLTGEVPFDADQMVQLVATVLEKPAPDVRSLRPNVPKELATIVSRCLEKDPARRYRSYPDLRAALLPLSSLVPMPANPARRYAAGVIDHMVLLVVNNAINAIAMLLGTAPLIFSATHSAIAALVGVVTWFLYFAVPEGLVGATFGKWMLGLRVVRAGTMRAPGLGWATLRTAIYCVVPLVPSWIYSWFGPSLVNAEGQLDFQLSELWPMMAVGLTSVPLWALLFITMRRSNGFAAVHDLAAGVRVIVRPRSEARPVPTLDSLVSSPVPSDAPALGPYHILSRLGGNSADDWRLGYDSRLLRKVWIRMVPEGTAPMPTALQGQSRSGRLRWLTGHRGPDANWDAFEAPTGVALWSILDRPHDWEEVRYWLLDMSEELAAALKDGTLPATLSLDRVWITAEGRAKLCDLPAPGLESADPAPVATRPGEVEPIRAFLHRTAAAALNGRRDPEGDKPFAVPLPLHARPIVEELRKVQRPEVVAAELRANVLKPARVANSRRWTMFAACLGIPLLFGLVSLIGTAPNYIGLAQQPDLVDLRDALTRHTDPFGFRDAPSPENRAALEVYITGTFGERIKDPVFWNNPYLQRNVLPAQQKLAREIVAGTPAPTPEELAAATEKIDPLIHPMKEANNLFRGPLMPLFFGLFMWGIFLWLLAAPSVLCALIFRGGPLWRIFGIDVVRADGQPASRLRFAWRQFVAWSPILLAPIALAMVVPMFQALHVSAVLAVIISVGLATLPLAAIVISTFFAHRTWPDRAANTWLVIR